MRFATNIQKTVELQFACFGHSVDFVLEKLKKFSFFPRISCRLSSTDAVRVIVRSEVGTMFCLSWLITWYGHVLGEFQQIVRLYDFFMACHPLMPIYLAADVSTHLLTYYCLFMWLCFCWLPLFYCFLMISFLLTASLFFIIELLISWNLSFTVCLQSVYISHIYWGYYSLHEWY